MSLFVPKEWKDRLVEFAGRRKLTNVATGEEIIVDVARNEGAVSQEGDAVNAANFNDLEQRVAEGFNKVDSDLVIPDGEYTLSTYITKISNGGANAYFPFQRADLYDFSVKSYSFYGYGYKTGTYSNIKQDALGIAIAFPSNFGLSSGGSYEYEFSTILNVTFEIKHK